jgi:diguanylate cyclase (GGDEF)-like protein
MSLLIKRKNMGINTNWYADPTQLKHHWRKSTVTYLIALLIIALLSVCSHFLVQSIVQEQESAARVVNLAGRQRMLSQRIARFAGELMLPNERQSTPSLSQEYRQAVANMADVHQALLYGSVQLHIPRSNSKNISSIFHQQPILLDQQMSEFLSAAKQIIDPQISINKRQTELIKIRTAANKNILEGLDALVHQYQLESEQAINKLTHYNQLSLIGMIITLLLEAVYIFRPLLLNLYRREQAYQKLVQEMEIEISDRIHFLAFHDPLTELPNRISLLSQMNAALQFYEKNKRHIALIAIGLDRFKDINESLGHDQGDDLLLKLSQRLTSIAQENDSSIARTGGDEFVLLQDNVTNKIDLMRILRQLNNSINQPYELNNCTIQLTASLGIAVYPEDGEQASDLLLHANQAMRSAKNEGGGCFSFFQSVMTTRMARRMKLEQELRIAINSNQLVLYYQPKINLKTSAIIGVEALIRWNHPQEGMLPPDEFIPIAEESGLIVELGDWVLVTALKQSAEWSKQNILIDIAINVSVKQLLKRNLCDRITALARQMDINPRYVQLELTENNIMDNISRLNDQLEQLQLAGFRIAIDDFGTGYSSLASLRNLPVKILKIDKSFVKKANYDEKDARIVRAIIDMGHSLNKIIIAEGIETKEQMALLQQYACDEGQGYLFAKPLPEHLITPLLKQGLIDKPSEALASS